MCANKTTKGEHWVRKKDKKIKGLKGQIKGMSFEQKVLNWLSSKGWVPYQRKQIKSIGEIDILGEKRKRKPLFREDIEYIIVECKNKEKCTITDFVKFLIKVDKFRRRKKDNKVSGLFVYNSKKGKLDDRIKELKKLLRVDLQEIIQIKSFKV